MSRNSITDCCALIAFSLLVRTIMPCVTGDRKSTRLNSSHLVISYAVFCLKKKSNILVIRNLFRRQRIDRASSQRRLYRHEIEQVLVLGMRLLMNLQHIVVEIKPAPLMCAG